MVKKKPGKWWIWGIGIGIWILIMFSACIPGIERTEPVIVLDPTRGGAGTSIIVTGSGFPAETQISVRLGPPSVGATPQSYARETTDADGRFALLFVMPGYWPDGTPIAETELVVVVLNQDGSAKATAPFVYVSSSLAPLTPALDSAESHRQMILAWHREGSAAGLCRDIVVYEGGYVESASCQGIAQIERRLLPEDAIEQLYTWTETYQSFSVERVTGTGEERVTTRIAFVGKGTHRASEAEVHMLEKLLEMLVPLS
jgi:hypothetical protein